MRAVTAHIQNGYYCSSQFLVYGYVRMNKTVYCRGMARSRAARKHTQTYLQHNYPVVSDVTKSGRLFDVQIGLIYGAGSYSPSSIGVWFWKMFPEYCQ